MSPAELQFWCATHIRAALVAALRRDPIVAFDLPTNEMRTPVYAGADSPRHTRAEGRPCSNG